MIKKLVCTTLAMLLWVYGSASNTLSHNFVHYNMANGLSQNTVNCISQDADGFVWLGTKDGLNRFDGLTFKVYRHEPNKINSIGSSYILSIYKDCDDVLWVGTDEGLYLYDRLNDNFQAINVVNKTEVDIPKRINAIKEDKSGLLWIVAGSSGVYCYDKATQRLKQFSDVGMAQCIEIDDSNGDIWIGTIGDGLYQYSPLQKKFKICQTKGLDLVNCSINTLLCGNGRLYVGTTEHGLLLLTADDELAQVETHQSEFGFTNAKIHKLTRRSTTHILVGTEHGLYHFNEITKEYEHYYHHLFDSRTISDSAVYSIFIDREDGVWVGTYFDGVNYFPCQYCQFLQYYPQQDGSSISGERVRELCEDGQGRIWVGTEDNWLSCIDSKNLKVIDFKKHRVGYSPKLSNVHGLACDDKYLWIGYYNGGIDRYDLTTGELKYISLSAKIGRKVNEDVFSLYRPQNSDELWIGTVSGVYVYDTDKESLSKVTELGMPFVYDIAQDRDGRYWFATLGSGVIRYDSNTQKMCRYVYDENDSTSIPTNKVLSVHVDAHGQMWFTTEGKGFCRYDATSDAFYRYDENNGLPNGVIYKIVEAPDNNFWFGTNNGLVKFNPVNEQVQVYMSNHGLASNQFNYKSGLIDSNGNMYFGTAKGLTIFNPKTFVDNCSHPTVAITSLSMQNEEIEIGADSILKQSVNTVESITLPHDRSTFTLEFVVLSYSSPKQNHFAYMMKGIDDDWIYLDKDNRIHYANLPPGDYEFMLKGANSFGEWSEQIKRLKFHVLPPFYLSESAIVIYLILAVSILALFYWLMRKRLVKKQMEHIAVIKLKNEQETIKQKIEFFTNVTHEIRTPLTLISSPLEYLLQDKLLDDDMRDCLQIMKLNVGRLLQLSNQLLDFHSVEKDGFKLNFTQTNLSQIIKDTNNRFASTVSQRSLKCSLVLDEQIWANVDYEAFVKIVSNLLGNALKHAYSYINIELREVNNSAILTVENDGRLIGMSLREKIFEPFFQIKDDNNWGGGNGSGLGLPLARKLAMLHDGTLHYKVSESGGNCFVLTLPLCVVASGASHLDNEMPEPDEDKALVVGRSTILLVEDDEELLNLMSKWMCADYNVVKAVNGLVALQQLETKDVDLIISDVMMPELDGIGLLKELKSNYKYSHIPVVFLTARTNLDIKVLSLDFGVDAYIEKPFSYSILKAQIVNLIEKKKDLKRLFSIYPIESVNKLTENEADRKFLEEINKAIDKHLDNSELNIDLLSKELRLSRSTINRKFKGLSEVTPGEYIKLFRLKKAAALLRSGNYRISEIVYLTGFSTSSYFAKCFKEQFGLLPNEYVKIYKGGDHQMSVSAADDE